jgi:hypothetical protein
MSSVGALPPAFFALKPAFGDTMFRPAGGRYRMHLLDTPCVDPKACDHDAIHATELLEGKAP